LYALITFFPFTTVNQALLDVYTIKREIGRLDGIKLGLVGDLANGRTVRSLAYLIAMYPDIKIYFVSPDVVKMKVRLFNITS
jgi:aspartate carbamoyltransferase catalytic subunit